MHSNVFKNIDRKYLKLIKQAKNIEKLILNQIHKDLKKLIYKKNQISFENIIKIFPNVKHIWLEQTNLNYQILSIFKKFILKCDKSSKHQNIRLESIKFSDSTNFKYSKHKKAINELYDKKWYYDKKLKTLKRLNMNFYGKMGEI